MSVPWAILPAEITETSGRALCHNIVPTFYCTVGIMEFSNAWQSKEHFALYLVHHFCLWSCLVGLHSPFDALLMTENYPAMSQSLCWVSVTPMLSPADWNLPAVIVKVQSQIPTSPFTHPCL